MPTLLDKDKYKNCSMCGDNKRLTDYYKSYSPLDKIDERLRVCKVCLKKESDINNVDSVKNILRMVDKPFNILLWESALTKPDVIGEYFKLINAKDYRHETWEQSIFEKQDDRKSEIEQQDNLSIENIDDALLGELKEKYGYGYPDEEYILFEKKFINLKPSFQLPTTMHEEYLREYCVNKVKETIAKAKGEFKEAKEWAAMAKESAEAGKLKPSQMSKADLSQGLDGFGQLARMVEEHQDIIPLLPKFVQQPKDKVDITLWMYINYVRDLKGMPDAKYEDLYEFYEERRKDYENQELDETELKEDNGDG
ncbi:MULTISPECIES: hypothetical protein [Lysinibacillus]|uniref:hypothetical protein n=1 Tax=Lysinibacillus TaxID=400634 RepID=UPI00214AC3A4|nr:MULTISPECIES: hypothetical protein [Lysinibacillus]UUV25870.1 hypothetical protein NP781_04440 [Lysinibacillus sp. FN11]UYB48743.1 hypothetical protein OCI51_07230 [Lysinibacillus capsici]